MSVILRFIVALGILLVLLLPLLPQFLPHFDSLLSNDTHLRNLISSCLFLLLLARILRDLSIFAILLQFHLYIFLLLFIESFFGIHAHPLLDLSIFGFFFYTLSKAGNTPKVVWTSDAFVPRQGF